MHSSHYSHGDDNRPINQLERVHGDTDSALCCVTGAKLAKVEFMLHKFNVARAMHTQQTLFYTYYNHSHKVLQ